MARFLLDEKRSKRGRGTPSGARSAADLALGKDSSRRMASNTAVVACFRVG